MPAEQTTQNDHVSQLSETDSTCSTGSVLISDVDVGEPCIFYDLELGLYVVSGVHDFSLL